MNLPVYQTKATIIPFGDQCIVTVEYETPQQPVAPPSALPIDSDVGPVPFDGQRVYLPLTAPGLSVGRIIALPEPGLALKPSEAMESDSILRALSKVLPALGGPRFDPAKLKVGDAVLYHPRGETVLPVEGYENERLVEFTAIVGKLA